MLYLKSLALALVFSIMFSGCCGLISSSKKNHCQLEKESFFS